MQPSLWLDEPAPASVPAPTPRPAASPPRRERLQPTAAQLRQAYRQAGYARRGITLRHALDAPALRLALQLAAEAIARRERRHH